MNPRNNSDIDGLDTIGSKDYNALIIFEHPKKYRDECIATGTWSSTTCFEENVGFVDEENRFPFTGEIE